MANIFKCFGCFVVEAHDWQTASAKYLLRPEVVESLFILWRKTKNEHYRVAIFPSNHSIHTVCLARSAGWGWQEGEWMMCMCMRQCVLACVGA